jgi:D-apiose dehydrogenase
MPGTSALRGACIGAGYFSQFHFDAWTRIDGVDIVAVCDLDGRRAEQAAQHFPSARIYTDAVEMLDHEQPDFVDIVTRPDSHLTLVQEAARRQVAIICQKSLAPTFAESQQIVRVAEEAGVPFMVHENFRFQPWYRQIRRQIEQGAIGDRLHGISFRCRTGDGWQDDAYLDRQPYFREMPRLLIFETGAHFVDTFRYLAGEIQRVYACLRKWNSGIAGEDAAAVMFEFESGAMGLWDGNRYNEPNSADARLTFGEALIEGSGGSLRLNGAGQLTLKQLGRQEEVVEYAWNRRGFAGDCVLATQQHFVDSLRAETGFETSGSEYLKTLRVVEAIYESAANGAPVNCQSGGVPCVSSI